MKKIAKKPLTLRTEIVRALDEPALREVAGGDLTVDCTWQTAPLQKRPQFTR